MGLSLPNNMIGQLQLTSLSKIKSENLRAYIQSLIISPICIFLSGIIFKMSYF